MGTPQQSPLSRIQEGLGLLAHDAWNRGMSVAGYADLLFLETTELHSGAQSWIARVRSLASRCRTMAHALRGWSDQRIDCTDLIEWGLARPRTPSRLGQEYSVYESCCLYKEVLIQFAFALRRLRETVNEDAYDENATVRDRLTEALPEMRHASSFLETYASLARSMAAACDQVMVRYCECEPVNIQALIDRIGSHISVGQSKVVIRTEVHSVPAPSVISNHGLLQCVIEEAMLALVGLGDASCIAVQLRQVPDVRIPHGDPRYSHHRLPVGASSEEKWWPTDSGAAEIRLQAASEEGTALSWPREPVDYVGSCTAPLFVAQALLCGIGGRLVFDGRGRAFWMLVPAMEADAEGQP